MIALYMCCVNVVLCDNMKICKFCKGFIHKDEKTLTDKAGIRKRSYHKQCLINHIENQLNKNFRKISLSLPTKRTLKYNEKSAIEIAKEFYNEEI